MCLAIPGKVLEIQQTPDGARLGTTDFGGILKQVSLEYTPDVICGDYVLVHVGFALAKVDEAEAERVHQTLQEMKQLQELEPAELNVNPFAEDSNSSLRYVGSKSGSG